MENVQSAIQRYDQIIFELIKLYKLRAKNPIRKDIQSQINYFENLKRKCIQEIQGVEK